MPFKDKKMAYDWHQEYYKRTNYSGVYRKSNFTDNELLFIFHGKCSNRLKAQILGRSVKCMEVTRAKLKAGNYDHRINRKINRVEKKVRWWQ